MRGQTACAIAEDSAVGAARRLATQIATKAGLSETETGKVQIVVTELGRERVGAAAADDRLFS